MYEKRKRTGCILLELGLFYRRGIMWAVPQGGKSGLFATVNFSLRF